MSEHYFSSSPQSAVNERSLDITLAGQTVQMLTAAGTFSPTRLDLGTAVLLKNLPPTPAGQVLDLGCGWGPLSVHAGLDARARGVETQIWALDINERALDLTRRNAAAQGLTEVRAVTAEQIPAEVRFSAIVSNPPIRVGKDVLHELLLIWLPRLVARGQAHLVVSKNLGADSLLTWLRGQLHALATGWQVEKIASAKGFRIIRVTAPADWA